LSGLQDHLRDLLATMSEAQELAQSLSPGIAELRNASEDILEYEVYLFERMQTQFRYEPDPNRFNPLL
jgi:hypothetical protein